VGTARVPEVDGERAGCESQIDVEKMTDLSEADQSPTKSVPDATGNGRSHGGGSVARRIASHVTRAVERGGRMGREALGVRV
jgi:hypothetical protein